MVNISPPQDGLTPFQRRLRGAQEAGQAAPPSTLPRGGTTADILRLTAPLVPKEDVSARVLKAALRLDVDRDLVSSNLEEAERIASEKDFSPEKLKDSPVLARWYAESPHHIAVTKADITPLKDLERIYYRKDDPLRKLTEEEFEQRAQRIGKRQGQAAMRADVSRVGLDPIRPRLFKTQQEAIEVYTQRARESLREMENYVTGTGKAGAFEAPGSGLSKLPIAGVGVDLAEASLLSSMKRVQEGTATEEDEDSVFLLGRMHAAAAARGQTFGGKVLEGIAALPGFASEFAMTGGVYRAGKVGAELALRRSLQHVLTGRARGMVRGTLGAAVGGVTQAAAQTAFLSLPADAIKRMAPQVDITPDEEGKLRAVIEDSGEDILPAISKAFGARVVENLSERSGVAFSKVLAPVKAAVAARWIKLNPGKGVNGLLSKVAEKTGWNGVVEEVLEERVGEVGRAALGIEAYKPPTLEDLAAEAATFALPAAGAALTRATASVNRARQNKSFFTTIQKTVRESNSGTIAPEALEDLIGRFAKNGGSDFAYVPIDAWLTTYGKLMTSGEVRGDPKSEALSLGVSESAFERAMQMGGDLQIPMAPFAVRVLKEKWGDAFIPLARTEPEQDTLPESEEAAKPKRVAQSLLSQEPPANVLDQSPEGLEGEAYKGLVDQQVEAAKNVVAKLKPGIYTVGGRDVELLDGGKAIDPNTGEEIDLPAELLPTRYTDESGKVKYEAGKKIQPNLKAQAGVKDATPEEFEEIKARAQLADQRIREAADASQALLTFFPDRHGEAIERARGSARQALVEKFSESIRKKRMTEYKGERRQVRAEVEAEVNERKEYVALSILRNGTLPSGAPAAVDGLKISREAINLDFPALSESSLPRGILAAKGEGAHPDEIAELLGYSSGSEMFMALIDAEYRFPRETLIEELTDARMAARNEAIEADPARAQEEAIRALHNTERSKLLLQDLKHLISEEFSTFKQLAKRIAGAVPRLADVTKWAETEVRKESFRTLHPGIYRQQAKIAGRKALDAFLSGDFQTAFDQRLLELRNNELAIAAQNIQEEARKIPKFMRKFQKRDVRESLAKAGAEKYLDPIDEIMERFEFSSVSTKTVEKRASLKEWYENEVKEGRNPVVPEKLLFQAGRQNWKDVKLSELLGIQQAVENIAHLAKLKNKLLTARERKEFDATVKALVTSMDAARGNRAPKSEPLGELTLGERIRRRVARGWGDLRKASNIAQELDGWKEGGAFWESFILPMNHAQEQEQDMTVKGDAKLFKILSVYSRKDRRQMHRREFSPEINASLSKWDRLMIALNWGNQENREALMAGYGWSTEKVEAVLSSLGERDWRVVEQLWEHIDSYWPEVKGLSQRVDGIAPEKVEAIPFKVTTSEGKSLTVRGGYFPLKYKPDPSKPHQSIEELVDQSMRGGTWRASTSHGHRKERVGSGGRQVRLDFGVLTEHQRDVIHDITHHEWLIDANKLLRDRSLVGAIKANVGAEMYDELLMTVNAVALNNRQSVNIYDRMAEWLARKTRAAVLVGSVATILKQYLGLFASGNKIGWGWTLKGLAAAGFGTAHTRDVEAWIAENSVFMKNRRGTQDRDQAEALRETVQPGGEPGVLGQAAHSLERMGFGLIGATQWHVDRGTWLGAYQRYSEELGLEKAGSAEEREKIEKRIFSMADQAVRDAQGSGLLADLPAVMRSRGALRLLTIFRTFAISQLNLFASKVLPASQRPSQTVIAQAATALVSLYILPTMLWDLAREAMVGGGDDDEDGSLAKKALTTAPKEIINSIPLLSEIAPAMDLVTGQGARDYRGPAGLTLVAESLRLAGQIGQVLEEGEDQLDTALLRSAIRASGLAIPGTTQIDRIIGGYLSWEEGESELPAVLLGRARK